VPLFSSLEAFYDTGKADLAILSSPIQHHAPHTGLALDHGSHVLVEKPAAAVTADVDRMVEARDRAGRFVAVGFQWSFSDSVLALKREILDGRFGAPLWGRSLTLWPRTEAYYRRNEWAGRKRDEGGRWILDSPASNAMAHHLHNLLFLLGPEMDRSAEAEVVEARLARVNRIETFDSIGARIGTSSGAEVLFLASHSVLVEEATDPRFALAFEEGVLTYPGGTAPMAFRPRYGETREYPAPDTSSQVNKLWVCVDAVRRWRGTGEAVIPCGLETSRPHAAFVEALERAGVEPLTFGLDAVRVQATEGGRLQYVPGLAAALKASYASGDLPEFPGGSP
jgi:predicted dehydrogenase